VRDLLSPLTLPFGHGVVVAGRVGAPPAERWAHEGGTVDDRLRSFLFKRAHARVRKVI